MITLIKPQQTNNGYTPLFNVKINQQLTITAARQLRLLLAKISIAEKMSVK
jgi:hypothetical protein